MRVVAFSCAHICLPETMWSVQGYKYDFDPVRKLFQAIVDDPPDIVVNLGDFTEELFEGKAKRKRAIESALGDLWEKAMLAPSRRWVNLPGNHDPGVNTREWYHVVDGVTYMHGDRITIAGEPTVENCRKCWAYRKIVHGHTHEPNGQGWPMDVGSITFNRTYGEVLDGEPFLRTV